MRRDERARKHFKKVIRGIRIEILEELEEEIIIYFVKKEIWVDGLNEKMNLFFVKIVFYIKYLLFTHSLFRNLKLFLYVYDKEFLIY